MSWFRDVFAQWDVVVRCQQGHLFHSIWWPLGSLKAIRWFTHRYQWCPVGRHWSWVTGVPAETLTPEQRREADRYHDIRVP